MNQLRTYRAVIIGAGIISSSHLKTMANHSRTELAAIADISLEKAQAAADAYGIKAYTDYKEMILEEKPDIAVITLPHFLHREASLFCAEHGCHVLLEKPMALNARECAEIIEAAKRAGIVLGVGHIQHFLAENIKAKQIVESGQLGKLVAVNDRRYAFYFDEKRPAWFLDKALSGGGIVINLGSHSIDRIQWITGEPIAKVKASLTFYGDRGNVEGSANLLMQTQQGTAVTVNLYGYRGAPANETEYLFTGGSLKVAARKGIWISGPKGYEPLETESFPDAFTAQWDELLAAVERGERMSISGEYARTVSAVIDAVYRSHDTGTEQEVEL